MLLRYVRSRWPAQAQLVSGWSHPKPVLLPAAAPPQIKAAAVPKHPLLAAKPLPCLSGCTSGSAGGSSAGASSGYSDTGSAAGTAGK